MLLMYYYYYYYYCHYPYQYHHRRRLSYVERDVSSYHFSGVRCRESAVKCDRTEHAETPSL
jgi:hypothetical protein